MRIEKDFTDFEKLDRELQYVRENKIIIGFLSEKYINGVNVQRYASYNEFGAVYIPARPFFRRATATRKATRIIEEYIKSQVEQVLELKKTGKQAMQSIGLFVVGQIQTSIVRGDWQVNSASTVKKKGKSNPLIDTGTMISSVNFEIKRK